MGQNVSALQWMLKKKGRVLETLAPTSEHPIKSFRTKSGVLFIAKQNEAFLELSFIAAPAAEMIKAICSDSSRNAMAHCDIILPGK